MSSVMMEGKMNELENIKVELEYSLQECQYREQQLLLSNGNLQQQLRRVTEEKEEREKEAVTWFNAVEKSREANRDLQVQLDNALREAQDPNSKGNSLFAELEDKRAEMEKQLIGMKVQYQSLLKAQAFSKQQLQRMKVQIATLVQLQGSRADPAQLERLQQMLCEKNGEIQSLMSKLRSLEKVEMQLKSNPAPSAQPEERDESYYTDLLTMKLNNALKEVERLGEELSLQRMKAMFESQRVLELERKLFMSEQLHKQAQGDMIRLQLKVEDLQHKYEPKEARKEVKKRKEKLPIDEAASSEKGGVLTTEQVGADTGPPPTQPDVRPVKEPVNSAKGEELEPRPAKCVRTCVEDPVAAPQLCGEPVQCEGTEEQENQQHNREQDRKWRRVNVEAIHVTADKSLERTQCAQQ